MRRILIVIAIVLIAVAALAGLLLSRGPSMLNSALKMYPPAPQMPAVAVTPIEDLLSEYEAFLRSKAPSVLAALQAGLSDAELDALEDKYGIKLTADLRALYSWRNGTTGGVNVCAFPDHHFVPLDTALADRAALRNQVNATSIAQRKAYEAFAGHSDSWIGLILDPAGDGYFFDPDRSESEGSFFFCFAEDGSYLFFPAFRNYLAVVVEGEKADVFTVGTHGVETADFAKAQEVWGRYGAVPDR